MPILPNLGDLPQAQFDKIVASFPGATLAEKSDAYKAWLTNRILDRVEEREQWLAQQAIKASLPVRPADPISRF